MQYIFQLSNIGYDIDRRAGNEIVLISPPFDFRYFTITRFIETRDLSEH